MAISVLTLNKVCVAFCDCTLKNVTPMQGSNGVANLFFCDEVVKAFVIVCEQAVTP